MEIVIKIPERLWTKQLTANDYIEIVNAVANGTPLPKYHGRLKDVDAFILKAKADREHSAYLRSWTADDVFDALNNSYAPTIIEADRGGEDGVSN